MKRETSACRALCRPFSIPWVILSCTGAHHLGEELFRNERGLFFKTRRTKRRTIAWKRPHMVMQRSNWLICVARMMGLGQSARWDNCDVPNFLYIEVSPAHALAVKASNTQSIFWPFLLAWIWQPFVKSRRWKKAAIVQAFIWHSNLLEKNKIFGDPLDLHLYPWHFSSKRQRNVAHSKVCSHFVRVHLPPGESEWLQHGTPLQSNSHGSILHNAYNASKNICTLNIKNAVLLR